MEVAGGWGEVGDTVLWGAGWRLGVCILNKWPLHNQPSMCPIPEVAAECMIPLFPGPCPPLPFRAG